MTGLTLKVACLTLLVLIAVPVASARTEFSADERQELDALTLEAGMYAGFEDLHEVRVENEFAWVDAMYMAEYVPGESRAFELLQTFLLLLPEQEVPAQPESPSAEVVVPDVAAETDALITEGVGTQGEGHATNQQVEVVAEAHAGSQSHGTSASARPADAVPIEAESGILFRESSAAPEAEDVAAPEEKTADAEPAPADSIATLAGVEQAIVQPISLPAALATTAAVIGVSTTTAFAAIPGWRTALMRVLRRFGWLVLFSRIAQEDILNHERRSELLEYVRNNPGERVEVARRSLGFSNGSMHYHLRVLQDRGLVKILKDGSLARLYPRGPKIQPAPYVPAQRKRFLDALSTAPGQTQRELSQALGLSERMVSYHVQALASQGLLEVRAEGARKRLFPAQTFTSTAVLAPAA